MKIQRADMREAGWTRIVLRSFEETGFAIITGHGISEDTLDDCYDYWRGFFDDGKFKQGHKTRDGIRGWFPMKSENAKGNPVKDLKEFYHSFYPYTDVAPRPARLALKMNRIAAQILSAIDRELHCDGGSDSFEGMIANSNNTLQRVLHYPPVPEDTEPGAVRAAAHEDINLITLLPAATAPGLEVQSLDGAWHKVESNPGEIIVNVGDMLQEATDGLYKSTTHRVVNPEGPNVSRYSMPLFIHPRPECRLSDRYTAGEYLEQRLREIGLKS